MNIGEIKAAHKQVTRWEYQPGRIDKGYNDRTLHIDLTTNKITEKPVTALMKDKFVGGKGFGLYLLWHATRPQTKWNDPENEIIISPGPCAGITQYAGAGKSLVVSISPQTGGIMDSNVGGYFGPYMKFSGFDAIELQGKAREDVIIVIDGTTNSVTIETAPKEAIDSHVLAEQLTEMYAKDEKDKMNVAVVSAGTAADHSLIGMLNFSFWDPRRKVARLKQAGRGGIGTVFRDKRIKAVVCKT
ncbi:MAG TPA: aldehyde ferredoxin oxidoreductase N-terminal domain-containing protein, partial [bacterium]|nr:aldehyde ferredoxin oxidoreductase N-terminal domain-containing protein [bacterium]